MVTSGFFNSLNHDRLYDADQFSSLFDGILRDGIFMSIGNGFQVNALSDMIVTVGVGRAWFNRTWTFNDALLDVFIPQSEILLNRIDAIVLDINKQEFTRKNDIIVVKGTPSQNPQRPNLLKVEGHWQYPLAYVEVGAGVTEIFQRNITQMVGTSATPWVTGILDTVNIDYLMAQWEDEWGAWSTFWKNEWIKWYLAQTAAIQADYNNWLSEWNAWSSAQKQSMLGTAEEWETLWQVWYYTYTNQNQADYLTWKSGLDSEFRAWFESISAMLDGDVATNLANRIAELEKCCDGVYEFMGDISKKQISYDVLIDHHFVNSSILDSDSEHVKDQNNNDLLDSHLENGPVLDSNGNEIFGSVRFSTLIDLDKIAREMGALKKDAISRTNIQQTNSVVGGDSFLLETGSSTKAIRSDEVLWVITDQFSGALIRRNIWRGKNLGYELTAAQRAEISSGRFKGFFIGDYWAIGGVTYRIADFDYWLGTGDSRCTKHHLVIVPDEIWSFRSDMDYVMTGGMNCRYRESSMRQESSSALNQWRAKIKSDFGASYVMNYRDYFNDITYNTTQNTYYYTGVWDTANVEVMSEIMMFGSLVTNNQPIDANLGVEPTINTTQLAIFRLNHNMINNNNSGTWLRDIISQRRYAYKDGNGVVVDRSYGSEAGVRPVFALCGS